MAVKRSTFAAESWAAQISRRNTKGTLEASPLSVACWVDGRDYFFFAVFFAAFFAGAFLAAFLVAICLFSLSMVCIETATVNCS